MDCKSVRESVAINNIVLENKVEHPIEGEFLLADYYQEIMQILKCIPTVQIMSKQVLPSKITLDGYVNLKILYLSPDSCAVHCFEQNIPYTKTIDLSREYDGAVIEVKANVEYMNCRAVNERRIDVRGAISFEAVTMVPKMYEVPTAFKNETVQQLNDSYQTSQLVTQKQKVFSMDETLDLPCEGNTDSVVLHNEQTMNVLDYKCIADKVVIKGEFICEVAFKPNKDDEAISHHKQVVPINQVIDAQGVDDGCKCFISMKNLSTVIEKNQTDDEGTERYSMSILCEATVRCFKEKSISPVKDAYSTKFEIDSEEKTVHLDNITQMDSERKSEKLMVKNVVPQTGEVLDLFTDIKVRDYKAVEGMLNIHLNCDINILLKDEEGHVNMVTKSEPMTMKQPIQAGSGKLICTLDLKKLSDSYTVSGADIDLRMDLLMGLICFNRIEVPVMDNIEILEDNPKADTKNSSLTIYYADPNERVWDIAKRYNTSVEDIVSQNNLETNVLEGRQMLLIPIVR